MPTRAKDTLPSMIKKVPCLTKPSLPRYSRIPSAKMRLRIPPIIIALLKSKDTSPTPISLRAFVSHLNHGEIIVAAKTIARVKTEFVMPHNPHNQRNLCLIVSTFGIMKSPY